MQLPVRGSLACFRGGCQADSASEDFVGVLSRLTLHLGAVQDAQPLNISVNVQLVSGTSAHYEIRQMHCMQMPKKHLIKQGPTAARELSKAFAGQGQAAMAQSQILHNNRADSICVPGHGASYR